MPIYIDDTFAIPPNEEIGLWRYMNFSQFVSLIVKSQIFFSKISYLGDEFEGTWFNSLRNSFEKKKNFFPWGYEDLEKVTLSMRKSICVNCWHINNYESAAMWNSYLKTNEGIAIKTSLKKMKKAFLNVNQYIKAAKMIYADFDDDLLITNPATPFHTKLKSYEYEQELRLMIDLNNEELNDKKYLDGKFIDVDLIDLIDEIYISPNSPSWLINLMNDLLKKYNCNFPIINSQLKDKSLK